MKYFLLSSFLFFTSMTFYAAEIHVPADYSTIQAAIDNASNGDVIIVARGRYIENIDFNGKEITVTSAFHLTNDEADIVNTIIDGSQPTDEEKGSCVSFKNGEPETSILKGFTITGGSGTKTYNAAENLYFRTGGGILIDNSSPTITNNIIENNVCVAETGVFGAGGGGIRMGFGEPIIINNIIRNNTGGYAGGMMVAYCNGATIKNNLIVNNTATGSFDGGGGVFIDWEQVTLENNTIANNHSGGYGGGIISTGTRTNVFNCIVYGNTADLGSPQIYKRFGGNANATYSCIEGDFNGWGSEVGVIDEDPLFDGSPNYYLSSSSPCIDAGHPSETFNDVEDQDALGNAEFPAMGTIANDMGAYGGQSSAQLSFVKKNRKIEGLVFSFANPYQNEGIHIAASTRMELKTQVFSIDGKQLLNTFTTVIEAGEQAIQLMISQTCIVVFTNETGASHTITLMR